MIIEYKSLDLETCVLLLKKKWHRQSIIFFSRLLFLQQVTKCHILWRISISLPWIEHILISLMAATTDKSQSICFILFIYFLRKPFLSITTCRKKKIWFPSEQEIKRYDHSMTSRVNFSVIFSWHVHNSQNRIHHFRHLSKKYSHERAERN